MYKANAEKLGEGHMKVGIVTDSVADIPTELVQKLDIAVVPMNVRFGTEVYRDSIDLSADQFYNKLAHCATLPTTSVPSPLAFAEVYDQLAEKTDNILVITLTSKLSGAYNAAVQSIELMKRKCQVVVVDSQWAIMAQGLITMAAARAAQEGASFEKVLDIALDNIDRVNMRAAFDTLKYLERGGRIGKAQAILGSVLRVNPIIGMKDGEVIPVARARSRAKALDHLRDFVASYDTIDEIAVEYANCPDDAHELIESFQHSFPDKHIYVSRASPVIGTHTGPGLITVSVRRDK